MYVVNLVANRDTPVNSRLSADVGTAAKQAAEQAAKTGS
jgi:hypothetical protein